MVFSSTIFLFLFLPVVLALYFIIGRHFRNMMLFGASLLFYAWGEGSFVLILLSSIVVNYLFGIFIDRYRHLRFSKLFLVLAVAFNLSLLLIFKYLNLIVDNINPILSLINLKPILLDPVHLPIGISFFTFQAITYVVDIYRNITLPQNKPVNVGLYISSFPQLIAGPIVRYHDVAEQILHREVNGKDFAEGIERFIFGLGKKVLLANPVAKVADQIFVLESTQLTPGIAWLGIICYTLQIYFDFSGYSDMAIGLGRMFGFKFPENFNYPYISRSIKEFWRRWHISLSLWFRDYLYIPLGGNRCSHVRTYFNLITVFFLCGLWHGASWHFVIWGLFHGFFLVIERVGFAVLLDSLWKPLRHVYALLVIMLGWVLFRSETLPYAIDYILTMFGFGHRADFSHDIIGYITPEVMLALTMGVIFSTPIYPFFKQVGISIAGKIDHIPHMFGEFIKVTGLSLILFSSGMCIASGAYNPFIYFRF